MTSEHAGRALGSPLRLTTTNTTEAVAQAAWSAVLAEFAAVDAALSNYRPDSGVSQLNDLAGCPAPAPVDRRLYTALATSDRAWRVTRGRFDPRVATVLQDLGRVGPVAVREQPAVPAGRATEDRRWLHRDPRARAIAVDAPVDLGGIGKGLALRWAWRRVVSILPGPAGALLDAGGDLVGRGPGPTEAAWLIAIEDPGGRTDPGASANAAAAALDREPLAVVGLEVGSICTSSTRLGRWEDRAGRQVHHLIDPATGQPGGDGLRAVTIMASDPAWAEIRTKELFLAGPSLIAAIARQRDLPCWWVTADGTLEMTPRARQLTRWP